MQILKINPISPESEKIEEAAKIIKEGGVVVYPTDTAYGLAADALNADAIGKLFIIKQRIQKPLPVIVSSEKMLKTIAKITVEEKKIMKKYWPGALTLILRKKNIIKPFLTLGLQTIGVRMPDYKIAINLVKATGTPLTSTSANISGKGNCYTPECVSRMFQEADNQPDLILDAGELDEVPVSTVAQADGKKINVLRQGPVEIK